MKNNNIRYRLCSCGKMIVSTSHSTISRHRKKGHIIPMKSYVI